MSFYFDWNITLLQAVALLSLLLLVACELVYLYGMTVYGVMVNERGRVA